jgi:hypothetical protein
MIGYWLGCSQTPQSFLDERVIPGTCPIKSKSRWSIIRPHGSPTEHFLPPLPHCYHRPDCCRLGDCSICCPNPSPHRLGALAVILWWNDRSDRTFPPWFLNLRFPSNPPVGTAVIMRQAVWVGVYGALLTWLQQERLVTLWTGLGLAAGLGAIEYLIRMRENARWQPGIDVPPTASIQPPLDNDQPKE